MANVIDGLRLCAERMLQMVSDNYSMATELAELLAQRSGVLAVGRSVTGGPVPAQMHRWIGARTDAVAGELLWVDGERDRIAAARSGVLP